MAISGPLYAGQVLKREVMVHAADSDVGVLGREVELHAMDLVVCSAWVLDPVWFFDGRLDFDDVERALAWLIAVFPEAGGRMTPCGIFINNQGVPLSEVFFNPEIIFYKK